MERRDFNLKINVKSLDDEAGTFTGLAAVYGNVDLGGDRILPGAFTRTLASGKSFPLLWQHNTDEPIGSAKVTDSQAGLVVNGKLVLADPTAQKAYTFMKAGVIKGLSIGYDTIQDAMDGDVRNLTELRLWECSIVTLPMNEAATITAVKSISDADRAKHLKAIDAHRKGIDRHQRGIREHLKAMFDDLDDDESDEDPADDPAMLESDEDDVDDPGEEEMAKSMIAQMREMTRMAESTK